MTRRALYVTIGLGAVLVALWMLFPPMPSLKEGEFYVNDDGSYAAMFWHKFDGMAISQINPEVTDWSRPDRPRWFRDFDYRFHPFPRFNFRSGWRFQSGPEFRGRGETVTVYRRGWFGWLGLGTQIAIAFERDGVEVRREGLTLREGLVTR